MGQALASPVLIWQALVTSRKAEKINCGNSALTTAFRQADRKLKKTTNPQMISMECVERCMASTIPPWGHEGADVPKDVFSQDGFHKSEAKRPQHKLAETKAIKRKTPIFRLSSIIRPTVFITNPAPEPAQQSNKT